MIELGNENALSERQAASPRKCAESPRDEQQSVFAYNCESMPTAQQLLRFLRKLGYRTERQKGSHLILKHPARRMLVVPFHRGDIPRGLFLRILKDAGATEAEFREG